MTKIPLWDFLGENHLETNVVLPFRFCFEHALRATELPASVKLETGGHEKKPQKI